MADQTRGAPPSSSDPPNATRFLRVEGAFWTTYGIRVTRAGQEDLGPGFLTLGFADAVRGSSEAETQAGYARTWAILNFGFALVGIGLLTASLVSYTDDHGGTLAGWPDFIRARSDRGGALALDVGWLLASTAASISREMTFRAIMQSVNAHNFDVATGRIR